MLINLKYNTLGVDIGPNFSITCDIGLSDPAIVTTADLLSGIVLTIDNLATQITITSQGNCTTFDILNIPTTTTTTTVSPTTTTTTTIADTTTTTTTIEPVTMLIGSVYDNNRFLYTRNTTNWYTENIGYATNSLWDIKFINNKWWAMGYFPDVDWNDQDSILTSDDGINWTGKGLVPFDGEAHGIAYNPTSGRIVAVGAYNNTIAYTDDYGLNWTGLGNTIFPGTYHGYNVVFYNNMWVALGDPNVNNESIAYSTTDGASWTTVPNMFSYFGTDAVWNGSIWVATGAGSINAVIATSPNGTSWTMNNYSGFNSSGGVYANAYGVAYGNGIFVAVGGGDGALNSIAWSSNGTDWNGVGTSQLSRVMDVKFFNGYFYICGFGGGLYKVYKSTDGINWSYATDIMFPPNELSVIGYRGS